MKIARIAYANTEPFFHFWPKGSFELVPGSPRDLSAAARKGEVVGGPLPLVDSWELEKDFSPLGPWGIAARKECRSVFVLSNKPLSKLNNATIGVTTESSTSVVLCDLLIHQKYGHTARIKRGFDAADDAWLVIGDQALKAGLGLAKTPWTTVTDLATEWWDWHNLPFVFAVWLVRNDLLPSGRQLLGDQVESSLSRGLSALSEVSAHASRETGVSLEAMEKYLSGFTYTFGAEERQSIDLFRALVTKTAPAILA